VNKLLSVRFLHALALRVEILGLIAKDELSRVSVAFACATCSHALRARGPFGITLQ